MILNKKVDILVVLFIFITSSFSFAENIPKEYEQARELGKSLGQYDALYDDEIPTIDELISKYEKYLINQDPLYQKYFIEGYYSTFGESFDKDDDNNSRDNVTTDYEDGLDDGEYFGNIVGKINGIKDYFQDRTKNYKRNIPSDKDIEEKYYLNRSGSEYKKGFLYGFKSSYEKAYNEAFNSIKVDENIKPYENGYESGRKAGLNEGKALATKDYYLNIENNWRKYYPDEESLIREYNLILESESYLESFISGYLEGLSEGYRTTYQQLHNSAIADKLKIETIPISGGEVKSSDGTFSIHIDKGIYYNDVVVKLGILPENYFEDYGLVKASNIYSISVLNKSNEYNSEGNIELKFEYYGKDNGGIYKLENDKWIYVPSKVEDGCIKADINPRSFESTTNIYCVFIDPNYNLLFDIRSHWAKEEIIALQRRGIASGYPDRTFKPDKFISKGELLSILSKAYNLGMKFNSNETLYYDLFYSLLINGYTSNIWDKPFKAEDPITYNDVEKLIKTITNSYDFKWESIATHILYEKKYKSKSYYSKDNYMTRAEAVYMLYHLSEWRY